MQRRDFLKLAGCYIAAVSSFNILSACKTSSSDKHGHFPQGVASADPGPTSLMLWTRAEPTGSNKQVELSLEFAKDPNFIELVYQEHYQVDMSSDYTLRILMEGLESKQRYYYRFISGDNISITGRTQTAPALNSNEQLKLAFVCCQERIHGFYTAYKRMMEDDLASAESEQIDFVLHLGDFIYETRNDPLQEPTDVFNTPLPSRLLDEEGQVRTLQPFIDGGQTSKGIEFANSLEDYRQLYKQYLSDPDLQKARARWPFICIWDDHEFSDDCWQSEANYEDQGLNSSTDEASQQRKVAANQAWFEYIPANLTKPESGDEDLHHSHDFQPVKVNNSPNNQINVDNLANNEDNLKAINSLCIYRSLQFGSLAQLILTDNRSYRSDHALPEDLSGNIDLFLSSRATVPKDLQNELDAGKTANNHDPSSFLFIGGLVFNPRRFSPPGSMLGAVQKQWFKQQLLRSQCSWKLWANSVPMMRFLLNLSAIDDNMQDLLLSIDSWDGYNIERKELCKFITDNNIKNTVSLAGDLHAHYAGEVWSDFDVQKEEKQVAMVEAVCAAISSVSQYSAAERLTRHAEKNNPLRQLVTYDEAQSSQVGSNSLVKNFNNTLLNGCLAALDTAQHNELSLIEQSKDPQHNAHLVYADGDANGYGLATISEEQIDIELVTIVGINSPTDENAMKKRTARFIIPHVSTTEQASISEPEFTGQAPFPFAQE